MKTTNFQTKESVSPNKFKWIKRIKSSLAELILRPILESGVDPFDFIPISSPMPNPQPKPKPKPKPAQTMEY